MVPQVRTKMREKGKLGKQQKKQNKKTNLRMNKSKENTLKYMHKVIITSRIEMLELPNFGHMTTCTSKYKYTHDTQNIYLYFKKT